MARRNADKVRNKYAGNAALSDDDVRKIRAGFRLGEATKRELADWFNVGLSTIENVISNRTYRWVPEIPDETDDEVRQQAMESQARLLEMLKEEEEAKSGAASPPVPRLLAGEIK